MRAGVHVALLLITVYEYFFPKGAKRAAAEDDDGEYHKANEYYPFSDLDSANTDAFIKNGGRQFRSF